MIPQEFDYTAPQTLDEALKLITGGERKILAGGMSLIPLMKLRLAIPDEVVDLGRVPGLNGISENGGVVRIGAMSTHHAIETSGVTRAHCPLLVETASHIGDVQVRNMGTIGGSVAHADPAADYPAALVALEAQIRLKSAASGRVVPASDFFQDAFTTSLDPGEIVVEIEVPAEAQSEGYAYEKVAHPASGFAVVGIAARIKKAAGRIVMARIGVTGVASRAFRATAAEQLLESGGSIADASALVGQGETANSDLYASADYRMHLARTHAARALARAESRAS
jgi:aerobic carbon-monoxide dehydrogenase medium subunit